ncbi:MAG: TonB-dependent receptor [Bacteroidia bacterium]|nr:TonB-dependent receptor [Bacteroidia bacterium]
MRPTFLMISLFLAASMSAQPDTLITDSIAPLEPVLVTSFQIRSACGYTSIPIKNLYIPPVFGQDLPYQLGQTPGATYYTDAGSFWGYSYLRLRGMDQTRIQVSLEGIPLSEPEDQGAYFSNFPDVYNAMNRVTITRGVGLSEAGTAGFAGTVTAWLPVLQDSAAWELGAGYGRWDARRLYGAIQTGRHKGWALYARGAYVHADGYKHRSAHTGYSGILRAGYRSTRHDLILTHLTGHQTNQLAWLGAPADSLRRNPRFNANSEEDDRFLQTLTSLRHTWRPGRLATLHTDLYYNHLQGGYDFDLNNFLGLPRTDEKYRYDFNSHMAGLNTRYLYTSTHLRAAAGLQAYTYARRHTGSERSLGQLYQNTGYKQEITAWTQTTYTWGRAGLQADLQLRAVGFTYTGDSGPSPDPLRWRFVNPRLAAWYEPRSALRLYANAGRTGREPTRNDMFSGNDDLPYDAQGRPALAFTDPESVYQAEAGARQRWRQLDVELSVYHLQFRNEIVLSGEFGPNGLVLNRNVARSARTGLEISYRKASGTRMLVDGNLSLSHNRIREGDLRFQPVLAPALIANQAVTYVAPDQRWDVRLHLRYQGRAWIDFANQYRLPPALIPDLTGSYTWHKVRFSLRLTNLAAYPWRTNGQLDLAGQPTYHVQAPLGVFGGIVVGNW